MFLYKINEIISTLNLYVRLHESYYITMWILKQCFIYLLVNMFFNNALLQDIEDAELTIVQILKKYGYPIEVHEVETEDGYLLDVHRVPHGKNNKSISSLSPVILMHGMLGSSENFILNGPKRSLAYLLADEGYDVWMPNARGNYHARKHKTLDPDKNATFWKFSWHELGKYDVPAVIDRILETTKKKDVFYIGHSQGTTTFFVMASERPEYQSKVKLSMSLAPSVFLGNLRHPILRAVSPHYRYWDKLVNSLNQHEFIPFISNNIIRESGKAMCVKNNTVEEMCATFIFMLSGSDPDQLDRSIIPLIVATCPAGASAMEALHYAQSIVTGEFRQYDFGKKENIRRYKSIKPPAYNLNITTPIALFYSENDVLNTVKDVERLSKILPNVVDLYKVPFKKFTHFDFIVAKDIIPLLYNRVIKLMQQYSK